MEFWGMTFLRVETINRHEGDPYLRRLTLFKCALFGVFLHRFLADDDECLHDHPWPFLSLILWGGYWEATHDGATHYGPTDGVLPKLPLRRKWYGAGRLLLRRATWAHRVELEPGRTRPLTLVVCGPKQRGWGFFTPFGWIPWRQYDYPKHCPGG